MLGTHRKGQSLHMEIRFESENHKRVKVKILHVRVKTYTGKSHLFIRANFVSVITLNIQYNTHKTSRVT